MSATIPAGYKPTEVGVIPEDWGSGEVGSLNPVITSGSRGWAQYYSDMGSAFVRITNLSRKSIYIDLSDLKLVKLPPNDTEGLRTQLENGDLLISITADIGIIGYVDQAIPKPAYINQHIALVRFDAAKANAQFLSYYLASSGPQREFRAGTDSGAKAGMNLAGVRSIKAAFPPLPEQRAIATALSDVDALLVKLDQIITKKRNLKQAAMQQLLTGQTRLPGFSGEWVERAVASFSAFVSKGATPTTYGFEWVSGGVLFLRSECVSANGLDLSQSMFISELAHTALVRGEVRAGDILMTITGNVGRVVRLGTDFGIGNTNQHIARIRVKDPEVSSVFVFHWLSQKNVRADYEKNTTGQAYPQISLKQVRETRIPLPSLDEQTAIATVLSDMDTELAALQTRRAKNQALKQGMMQELLTGRIRLV
jgi:type I restriction enzyme S subunit